MFEDDDEEEDNHDDDDSDDADDDHHHDTATLSSMFCSCSNLGSEGQHWHLNAIVQLHRGNAHGSQGQGHQHCNPHGHGSIPKRSTVRGWLYKVIFKKTNELSYRIDIFGTRKIEWNTNEPTNNTYDPKNIKNIQESIMNCQFKTWVRSTNKSQGSIWLHHMSFVSMSLNQLRIMSSHLAMWLKKTQWNYHCGFACVKITFNLCGKSQLRIRSFGPIDGSSNAKPISLKSWELNQLQGFVLLKHGTLPCPEADLARIDGRSNLSEAVFLTLVGCGIL